MSERILVTGATGKVGSGVARLLTARGVDVKAATRRPDRGRAVLGDAVEVVEFDYDRAETYDGALEWVDRVFLVPPPFDPHASELLSSFLDWAIQAGARHLVSLSAIAIEERDDLALRRLERQIEETGVGYTFLRPNIYMQNFHPGFLGREICEEGAFHLPCGDARVSLVDAGDVAAVAAEVLTTEDHLARAYTLTGPEALDHDEVAGVLSEAAGRDIRYVRIDDDAMAERVAARGWPPDQVDVVVDFFRTLRSGARSRVTDDVERVLARPATRFADFAREHADAWRSA
ncbi:MAG TPA: NmrA family NAD(P)-binding protein [Candidatus Thermoplasmatota archaeon]